MLAVFDEDGDGDKGAKEPLPVVDLKGMAEREFHLLRFTEYLPDPVLGQGRVYCALAAIGGQLMHTEQHVGQDQLNALKEHGPSLTEDGKEAFAAKLSWLLGNSVINTTSLATWHGSGSQL